MYAYLTWAFETGKRCEIPEEREQLLYISELRQHTEAMECKGFLSREDLQIA